MTSAARAKKTTESKTLVTRVHESTFNDADARAFVAVADAGSFTGAATQMALTPSAVSKAITRLESTLGVRLLVRTTRALHLTDEGMAFRDRCRRAFALLAEAAEEAASAAGALSGTIRIGVPPIFGTFVLPPVLPSLLEAHPGLRIEIVSTMRVADIVDRGLDLAIAVGELPDSSFLSRPLGAGHFVTVASPRYLKRAGTPKTPDDLATHQCLTYVMLDGREAPWMFRGEDGTRLVPVEGHLRSDDLHHLAASVRAGLGVTQLPALMIDHALQSNELVRVLREHEPEPKPAALVFPSRAMPRRVRVFTEHLVGYPEWIAGVRRHRRSGRDHGPRA